MPRKYRPPPALPFGLQRLIALADSGYPTPEAVNHPSSGDGLAGFIRDEIVSVYDPALPFEDNQAAVLAAMNRAILDLDGVACMFEDSH